MSFVHRMKILVWGEAAATAAERKLVRKIDFFVLTYCCVSYFFNYVDRGALGYAYVSGMKEDLKLVGIEYNMLSTILLIGYILGQVPHAIALKFVAPRIWMPAMTIVWAGLTMCSAAVHNYASLMVIRFFLGVIEASTFAGTHYIIGSWYTPAEVGKRAGLFAASGQAGTMFAGLMMTAMYKSMNGLAGLAGWRWVFIIDGIITLPIAIFGLVYFPDLPATTKAPYLSPSERALAVSRLPAHETKSQKVDLALVKRVLFSWTAWVFVILWFFGGLVESYSTYTCMLLWMKTAGYSVSQNNTYPLVIQAISIIAILGVSIAMDASGKRLPWGLLICGLQILTGIILLNWNHIDDHARFAAYWIAGTSLAMQPITFTWANIVLARQGDDLARSVILYSMNGASATASTFWGVVFYPATDASTGFFKGNVVLVVVSVFVAFWFGLCWLEDRRTAKIYGESDIKTGPSSDEEVIVHGTEVKGSEEVTVVSKSELSLG